MMNASDLKIIRSVINKHVPEGYSVFLFGSRVKGVNRRYSDVDIGIKGKKKLEMKRLGLIKAELEESNLPYRVDVVDFNRVSSQFKNVVLSGEVLWIKN